MISKDLGQTFNMLLIIDVIRKRKLHLLFFYLKATNYTSFCEMPDNLQRLEA
jgi:hypothetical protein